MPAFCRAAPEPIRGCRGGDRQVMYTYRADEQRCTVFVTYGCDRGRNMFNTMAECEEQCGSSEREGGWRGRQRETRWVARSAPARKKVGGAAGSEQSSSRGDGAWRQDNRTIYCGRST